MEDNIWWMTTVGGRQSLVEDDRRWKTTYGGRRPVDGRRPSVVTPPLDSHSTTEPKLELLSAVSTGTRICHCRKMYAALCMHTAHVFSKTQSINRGICGFHLSLMHKFAKV